jgi:hypothetical protein
MTLQVTEAESKEKHGVGDPMPVLTITHGYNLTLCPLQSQLQHIYQRHPMQSRAMPESTLSPPVRDFEFGLWNLHD